MDGELRFWEEEEKNKLLHSKEMNDVFEDLDNSGKKLQNPSMASHELSIDLSTHCANSTELKITVKIVSI